LKLAGIREGNHALLVIIVVFTAINSQENNNNDDKRLNTEKAISILEHV
jgi:hypothetical protein